MEWEHEDYGIEDEGGQASRPHLNLVGVEVNRDFIRRLKDPLSRRDLIEAVLERSWVDLDLVLDDLAEFFAHDPSWIQDVYDLLAKGEALWEWIRGFDVTVLTSFERCAKPKDLEDPQVARFFVMIGNALESRREAFLSPDARHYPDWLEGMLHPTRD